MKNKKTTSLLIIIVLFIWGAVIYRFIDFNTDTSTISSEPKPLKFDKKDVTAKKEIKIDVHYRDPFLGKMYNEASVVKNKKQKTKITPVTPPEPIPAIIYKGLVSDKKDSKKVYMISINGKNLLMGEKQTEEGITIITGDRKELTFTFKGRKNKVLLAP